VTVVVVVVTLPSGLTELVDDSVVDIVVPDCVGTVPGGVVVGGVEVLVVEVVLVGVEEATDADDEPEQCWPVPFASI
jgi:hypothetical protein